MNKHESFDLEKVKDAPGLEDISELFPLSSCLSSAPVAKASMKLLAFWLDAAEVWFAQADTLFSIRSITISKTKFYHKVSVLSQEVASQISLLLPEIPMKFSGKG